MSAASVKCCLSIGVFDGLHLGHRAVLTKLREVSEETGRLGAVVTFRPHPDEVLKKVKVGYISSWEERCRLLAEAGVSWFEVVAFTPRVASMSAEEFLSEGFSDRLSPVVLVVGYDFKMGKGREGGHRELRRLGARMGFEVFVVDPVYVDGEIVSSTAIRSALSRGDVARASRMLGRDFSIQGTVVSGAGRGATLGVPTANLEVDPQVLLPADGVYAVKCDLEGERLSGVANIGFRPTFGGTDRVVEVHLLRFKGGLAGHRLKVLFVTRLREEKRFSGAEALTAQMRRDIREAERALLGWKLEGT